MSSEVPASPDQAGILRSVGVAFFGFGNANQSCARLILEKKEELARGGLRVFACAAFTGRHGAAWLDVSGGPDAELPLGKLLGAAEDLSVLSSDRNVASVAGGLDIARQIALLAELRSAGRLHAIVEAAPADYATGEPALSLARAALELGVHVVSANKVPVTLALRELEEAAAMAGCRYLFESACMDGVPIFNMARRCLPGAKVLGFEGILNSTTNVIISAMEDSPEVTFEEGLARAQAAGIAETDPSGDIDGTDAAVKCVCLCRALLRAPLTLASVQPLDGIRAVGQAEIAAARADGGCRLMLVCEGRAGADGRSATCGVRLKRVPPTSPMHSLRGASACLTLHTDVLGPVTIVSTDPTIRDTGYGLLADLLEAAAWQP